LLNFNKKGEGKMKKDRARQVSISLTESEFEKYKKLARMEGKSFSKWIRDKVEEAISKEKREIALLVYTIKKVEKLKKNLIT
jgi:trans-2-enoyl-CoA reductase